MPFLYFTAVGIPTLGRSVPTLGNQPWVSIPTVNYSNNSSPLGNIKLNPKGVALG